MRKVPETQSFDDMSGTDGRFIEIKLLAAFLRLSTGLLLFLTEIPEQAHSSASASHHFPDNYLTTKSIPFFLSSHKAKLSVHSPLYITRKVCLREVFSLQGDVQR